MKISYSIPLLNPVNYYLNNANIIMPNSKLEAKHLSNNFKFKNNMSVIHNGVESFYRKGDKNIFIDKYNMENFILFVGRIEPKKNVLTLIKAVNDSSHKLVLIGDTNSDPEYYMMCKNNAGNNVNFLGNIPHNSEMLRSAYHAAKCFVLPSWLETPGIAALEASLAGCNLVITDRGSTKEYFKDKVIYCDPKNLNSIKKGIEKGMNLNEKTDLSNYIIDNFSWQNIAKNILIEYNKIIS
jgi:glycosyltransferase involved in cell wall biosynthesis